MQPSTVQFIDTALRADATIPTKLRQELLTRITGKDDNPVADRLLTRQEVAKRLAVSCRSVDLLARAGRLRKVFLTGQKRGGRIPESEVISLIEGKHCVNRQGGVE